MMTGLSATEYIEILAKRPAQSHKGTFGVAGIVGGSECYQGAACLATKAALHSGAGIVVSFVPEPVYLPLASKVYGAVIEKLCSKDGGINDLTLLKRIAARKCTALLCGSGIGLSSGAFDAVRLVAQTELPVVFDGDALTLLSRELSLLSRKAPTVLTAHIGEFSRLCSKTPDEIINNRATLALNFAKEHNVIVVLKDYVTVIALSNGKCFELDNPTSALSKGGSGDVLAGMLASFLSQGITAEKAAIAAVTLHNACGHACAEKYGEYYSQPENLIDSISGLI